MTVKFGRSLGVLYIAALILVILAACPVFAQQTTSTFYFHDITELGFSYPPFQFSGFQVSNIRAGPNSTSARVFQYATTTAPTGGGIIVPMSANISISSQPQGYIAFVAWETNTFQSNVTLDGNVVMHVWMSSADTLWPWQASELFMGVADYSPAGSTRFQLLDYYLGNATLGYNEFSNSPTEYVISTLRINQHQFQAGSMLMFFAGAGSNKQGYSFTVYFDSPTWNSRAEIPADPSLTLPEFTGTIPLTIIALLLPLIIKRKLSKH